MRNLKKVLSLVLCMAVMLSVMVVGAGAAFKDQSKIVNAEAVDACSALNIINGYPDGSYKPEGTITRAEACKMICVALNGGKEPTLGTTTKASFTDTKGHWAEKYIESCVAQGIVAGIGGGKFNPNGNVTGSQFAKMLLIALGYNSDNQGYTGAPWEVNVNVDASAKGLYEGLAGMDPSKALSRDNAAQMVWNALNAYEVEYKYNLVTQNGQLTSELVLQDKVVGSNNDKITLLEDKYEAKAITGTLTAVKQDNGKTTYNITIQDPQYKGEKYNDGKDITYTDVAKDYSSLKYQNVRVLVKPSKNGKDAVVYGVYATNKNTTQSGLLADLKMDGSKVKLDGVKYDLADTTYVYVNGKLQKDTTIEKWVKANAEGTTTNEKGSTVKLLATDGTTDYSILQVTTYAIEKVKYVGGDYLTTDSGKKSDDDYNYSSDIKKNDYVMISAAGNYADKKGLIEKADVVDGKIDSTKTDSGKINKVQIDGTWYTTNVAMTGNSALKLGATVKLVLVNGYIYKTDKVTTAASDIALLVETGKTQGVGSKMQARLIFADGSDKVVDIEKTWGDEGKETVSQSISATPTLVTYDVSKDVYTLTKITTADTAGYDQYVEMTKATVDGSATGTGLTGKLYFESTGIVFVRQDDGKDHDDPEFKVVTGKTAANWDLKDTLKESLKIKAVADYDNSNLYAQVAVVDFGANKTSGSSDKTYAVALDASYTAKDGGTTYTMVKAWNGTKEETFKYEGTISGGIAAGTIFEYSDNGDGTVDIDLCKTEAGKTTFTRAKVVSYDEGTGDIVLDPAVTLCDSKIDSKDTVVLYVDSDAGAGVGGGEIRQANAYNGGSDDKTLPNVAIFSEAGEDQITVIVVDVNNDYTAW